MKIVNPSAEVYFHHPYLAVEDSVVYQPKVFLEMVGRTCYQSQDKITPTSASNFIQKLNDLGHSAMLEHVYASVKFVCDRGTCYSEDTSVLTNEGWKLWPDVRGDECFATLGKLGEVEYQEATKVIREHYDGEMYRLRTSLIDLCVTPNHNVYIQKYDTQAAKRKEEPWQLVPVQEIAGKRVKYKKNANKRSTGVQTFCLPDFHTTQGGCWGNVQRHTRKGREINATTFAKFLGYWLSEGSLYHKDGTAYNVELFQNKGPILDEMLTILEDMGYKASVRPNGKSDINMRVRVNDAALYQFLLPYHGAINKRIPREILSSFSGSDLLELIVRYVYGDGSIHHKTGHVQAYTISAGLADDLQEAALYSGMAANIRIDDRVGEKGGSLGIVNKHICYVVSVVQKKLEPLVNHSSKVFQGRPHEEWLDYSGMVYCVTVPNHTLYVRRNGRACWSGNSHEVVRHRLTSLAQSSTRYCNFSKGKFGGEISVIEPPFQKQESMDQWEEVMKVVETAYMDMIARGETPQIARSVLPNCLQTELWVSANMREWQHIFSLRLSSKAHPQIREIMELALPKFIEILPEMFDQFAK